MNYGHSQLTVRVGSPGANVLMTPISWPIFPFKQVCNAELSSGEWPMRTLLVGKVEG